MAERFFLHDGTTKGPPAVRRGDRVGPDGGLLPRGTLRWGRVRLRRVRGATGGQDNGNPANAWALEEVARRARQLIWFTPEQRACWAMGSGDMPTYAQLCDRVEVARSLDQLDDVVDDMVAGALRPTR